MAAPPDRPPPKTLDELTVDFRPLAEGERHVVLAGSSYGGDERVPFAAAFSGEDLARLVVALEHRVRGSARAARPVSAAKPEEEDSAPRLDPEAIGTRLFETLFGGPGAGAFEKVLHHAEGRASGREGEAVAIRLRLLFSARDADLAAHAAVPWELLYRAKTRDFLARVPGYSLARQIDVDRPIPQISVSERLRVLLVDQAPIGVGFLDLGAERRRITAALKAHPAIEVQRFEEHDLGALRATLERERVHVLHFMGHGDFDSRPGGSGEGCLVFEDELRRARLVPATALADHLKNLPALGLVVLNACTAGALPRREGLDPFKGVASALTMAGVPATVAMQFPITDRAAIAFADAFYRQLAEDERVEDAVGAGRRAIWEADFTTLEWATPVLYSSAPRGKIFDMRRAGRPSGAGDAAHAAPASRSAAAPLRLGIRSMKGWGPEIERDSDRVLDLTGHFDGRAIREPALWTEAVYPALRDFLLEAAAEDRPLLLDLAAHWSLAFAAGAVLEAKSGLEITVRQRTQNKPLDWHPETGEIPEPPFWQERPDRRLAATASREATTHDVAVAIAVSRPVIDDVEHYLEKTDVPVTRILDATVQPKPGQQSIRSGAHALALAHSLDQLIRSRTIAERYGTLHLFASAPNALLLFLGQLSRPFGRIQLYEHDFDATEPGAYTPSLRLPVSRSKITEVSR